MKKTKDEMAIEILESINEGFNKHRLIDTWFGDNPKRNEAFKRAILALKLSSKIGDSYEEFLIGVLNLKEE